MKKKGFTLIELLVVIAIIAMLLAILMPALNKVKKIAQRVVCGTNLKGLGTAHVVYANDYEDDFVLQGGGGNRTWDYGTAQWQIIDKDWAEGGLISVGASLYLLVREADVSPKSFVCGGGGQREYDGQNGFSLDLVELWDFGHPEYDDQTTGPANCVSYSYQMPYDANGDASRYAADGTKSAAFAIMADKNPFFDPKLIQASSDSDVTSENFSDYVWKLWAYYLVDQPKWKIQEANAQPHGREGQNVLYGDGHASYEKTPDIGVKHDNIYTRQTNDAATEHDIRQGDWQVDYSVDTISTTTMTSSNDTLLVNDDLGG